ncbi:MAG: hypothetical protein IJ930_03265 [Lachnospiraceae bacterium]|nr:hypothetical protein [Lachnospiraceae bacterium]
MNSTIDISMALDYGRARTRLGLSLIPARGHEEMLAKVPYTAMEDLALIYKVEMGPVDSIIISNDMLDGYGISFEELRDDALYGVPKRHPCVIRSLASCLKDLADDTAAGEGEPDLFSCLDEDSVVPVLTASTADMFMGACVIAYPGMLAKASDMMGGDLYILPSSVHEVLLVKAEGPDCRWLQEIVSEVNRTMVDRKDRLSDNVYYYDSRTGEFMTAAAL